VARVRGRHHREPANVALADDAERSRDRGGLVTSRSRFLGTVDPVSWMRLLAQQYARFQRAYPDDRLLIVFDVDGVVVDPRHAPGQRLLEYHRVHNTDHFDGLEVADLNVGRNQVEGLLAERDLSAVVRRCR
jgi:hypothetical protein